MENRIANLKYEFNNINSIRNKIIHIFESLKNKMDKLKLLYAEFIKNNKNQLFVFGLDSFHFQSKLFDLEYDDMKRMFLAINNRMYCEYFKLYKIIVSYISENVSDKKIMEVIKGNNFPIYKDLEPFKDYKFEIILEIHDNILNLLNSISSIINNRENELSLHKENQLIGLNIDNFVNSFNYEITVMKEKIKLFLTYIEFFHKLHEKYLTRFNNKISLMLGNINSDIHFDENIDNPSKNNIENIENIEISQNIQTSQDELSFNNHESGLNTPNNSYKSNHTTNSGSFKIKVPKVIKNGIKKVNEILNGCSNIKKIENNETFDLISFEDVYKKNEVINDENMDEKIIHPLSLPLHNFDHMLLETTEPITIDMNDISKLNDLKSDSDSSELTNDTNSNILPVNDDKNIGVYVQEEIPKKRKKYRPRKNKD